jgi:anaerobic magnesium-protoporphyrin IX monomethyl ester cyclase
MTDCLFIGHNDGHFPDYVDLVRSLGTDTGPWRRLNLACVEIGGVPHRSMDVLNRYNGRDGRRRPRLSNLDAFSPTIAYLVSYVTHRGFSADYVNLFQEEKEALARILQRDQVRAVAISTTLYVGTWWIDEVTAFVRRHNPAATIIVGGPYLYNQSVLSTPAELTELFEHLDADVYVISREGEHALAEVLGALKHGGSLESIDNIAYRHEGRYARTGVSVESNPLADNMVDYELFPPERIGEFVSVRTSKSCPFACSFCSFPQQAGKYVYEGIDTVERELDRVRRVGTVTSLTFLDDTFNVPMGRFKEILRMMVRNGYGFRWNSFLRADHVDDECVDLMQRSGCEGVFLGVESGSDAMLKRMNKTSRAADYRRVIPQLKAAGILTHCSLIVGFPGETRETVQETIDLVDEASPDTYRAQVWYCDPSTPVWKKRDELGLRGSQFDWSHPTMDAATAGDLVDEMFLTIASSTWLPQHGFESRSLFYLQRKGMPLAQILRFLRHFNDAVKFKLKNPAARAMDPRLLRALAASSRFEGRDRGVEPGADEAALADG